MLKSDPVRSWFQELAFGTVLATTSFTGCHRSETDLPPSTGHAEISAKDMSVELPNKFRVTEDLFCLGTDFTLTSKGKYAGSISQSNWIGEPGFNLYNSSGKVIAHAQESNFSWGVQIDIFDENKKKIGSVEEQIIKSMLSPYSQYVIRDGDGKAVATSQKSDLIYTSIKIRDNDSRELATLVRTNTMLGVKYWSVEFADGMEPNEKLLMAFIAAYKTYADNERETEAEAKKRKDKEKTEKKSGGERGNTKNKRD